MRYFIGALAVLAIMLAGPAFAQEAAKPVIDFTPILNELLAAVAAVIGAAVIYLVTLARAWIKAKTGVQINITDEQVREYLDRAIQYGIAFVVGKLDGKAKITVGNEQIATIANYVIAAVPDALARFGITPERLQDMIRARLAVWSEGKATAEPAAPSA